MISQKIESLAVGAMLLLGVVPAAHAYLDAGTGSLIVQGIVAAAAGALIMLKVYWLKVKGFFRRLFGSNVQSEQKALNDSSE